MPLRKPKYSLIKNTSYALSGLKDMLLNESSFKVQIISFFIFNVIAFLLPIEFHYKIILSLSLFFPILAEITNSAIERVVDLVTEEHHDLAKRAKDVGSTLVFTSIIFSILVWLSVLYISLYL